MTEEDLKEMAQQYYKLEAEILSRISKLPNYNEDCNCEEPFRFGVTDDEPYDHSIWFCLNCGGNIYSYE